jgi:hypothetical protein
MSQLQDKGRRANLGKMFPLLVYRQEASWRERLAISIGMWPRGEVGAVWPRWYSGLAEFRQPSLPQDGLSVWLRLRLDFALASRKTSPTSSLASDPVQ